LYDIIKVEKMDNKDLIREISEGLGVPVAIFSANWSLKGASPDVDQKMMEVATHCMNSPDPKGEARREGMTLLECQLERDVMFNVLARGENVDDDVAFASSMLSLLPEIREKRGQDARFRTFLVNQLANSGMSQESQMFVARLGYHDDLPRCAVLFSSSFTPGLQGKEFPFPWESLFANEFCNSSWFEKEDIHGICGNSQYLIFKKVPSLSFLKNRDYLDGMAKTVIAYFKDLFHVQLSVHVGSCYNHFSSLYQSYHEAVFLQANKRFLSKQSNDVLYIDQHIFEYFCLQVPSSSHKRRFADLDANIKASPKQWETVFCLCQNDMNLTETSRKLGIHRNTLMQRYEKLKKQFSIDPLHSDEDRIFLWHYVLYHSKKTILHTGNIIQQGSVLNMGIEKLADLISEKSGGTMVLEIQDFSISGNNEEFFNLLCQGSMDLIVTTSSTMNEATNGLSAIMEIPFLFNTPDQAREIINRYIVPECEDPLAAVGVYCLGVWSMGWRYLTSAHSPVITPHDLAGKKVRIMHLHDVLGRYLELMGAESIQTNYDEVFKLLEADIVECQENPFNNILAMGFYKYQKFITDLHFQLSTECCLISLKVWSRLTEEQQAIIRSAMDETNKWLYQEQDVFNNHCREVLVKEKGMVMVPVSKAIEKEWRDIAKGMYDSYPYQDILNRVILAKQGMTKNGGRHG